MLSIRNIWLSLEVAVVAGQSLLGTLAAEAVLADTKQQILVQLLSVQITP